ncbi:hypothetical protein V8C86DRAFT_2563762 [Haematococcus lacustris]
MVTRAWVRAGRLARQACSPQHAFEEVLANDALYTVVGGGIDPSARFSTTSRLSAGAEQYPSAQDATYRRNTAAAEGAFSRAAARPPGTPLEPTAISDLARANAPTQVLELIGDPRSGVVDDVTRSPAGSSVMVDMIHYQQSNEVYWYKWEQPGDPVVERHRDGRLSELSKNLLYLLRAHNPTK